MMLLYTIRNITFNIGNFHHRNKMSKPHDVEIAQKTNVFKSAHNCHLLRLSAVRTTAVYFEITFTFYKISDILTAISGINF